MDVKSTSNTLRARHKSDGPGPSGAVVQQEEPESDDQEYVVAVIKWLLVGLLMFLVIVSSLYVLGFKVKPSSL